MQPVGSTGDRCLEGRLDLLCRPRLMNLQLNTQLQRRLRTLLQHDPMHFVGRIDQHRDPFGARHHLVQQLHALGHEMAWHKGGHAGQVAAGMGEACREPQAHRIGNASYHDRDRRRGVLRGTAGWRRHRDDQVRAKGD